MRKKKNRLNENTEELYKKSVIRRCRIEENIEENTRLDKYMGFRFSYYSRNKWQDLIGRGLVLLNNKKVKYTRFVKKGDEIAYHIIDMKEPEADRNVNIVYDDGDLIVANKPANLPVIPSGKYYHNTLHTIVKNMLGCSVNMLNRIDRETSGCVVLSRSSKAASNFCAMLAGRKINAKQYKKNSIKKIYIAVIENAKDIEDKFIVEGYMLESRHKYYRRFQTLHKENIEGSKYSKTAFKTIKKIGDYAIVMARLYTGRMHQIRVHLYSKNLFMVGDKIYGRYGPVVFDNFIEKNIMPEGFFKRQALHAYSLTFNHPITDKIIKVKAPIPEDLKKLIKNIQNKKTND
ncbi:RluA family pseudouridine synthase [uncultured Brachyspira sp.]|uniref:RluA family pseudouridine synthase n=1 Tax=uncultured Brachyspira sp. TaxID=221953 RepID=UPI0025FE7A17|nr:RluA family pseudouridine synthase [uncultured Brachyspira sp.]